MALNQYRDLKDNNPRSLNKKIKPLYNAVKQQRTVVIANNFADDVAAATGGIPIGGLYHTNGAVKIRLS